MDRSHETISPRLHPRSGSDGNSTFHQEQNDLHSDEQQHWLNKPDGGRGWASYFVSEGYEVYLVDQTFRGRSNYPSFEGAQSNYSSLAVQQRFTAIERYNIWEQAKLHTQWPGTGVQGDDIFDAFYASNVIFISNATAQQVTMQDAGATLLDVIGKPSVLIPHSQGGLMGWTIGDARPDLTKAIFSMEPSGPPFFDAIFSNGASRRYGLTDMPLTYSPAVTNATSDLVRAKIPATNSGQISNCTIQATDPPPRQLVNLAKIPITVLTSEASYHVPYDWCTVEYLKQAGVNVTHLSLPDVGVNGNGHFVYLEKNSDDVAGVLLDFLKKLEES